MQRTIRLRGCAGWSAPLLFAYGTNTHNKVVTLAKTGCGRNAGSETSSGLGPKRPKLGSESSWVRKIPRVRKVLGPNRPATVGNPFEQLYLQDQLANFSQILSVASLGWGKGCIRFWGRSDQNCGFHGNTNLSLTYNGQNGVPAIS